jgi:hypothetical protein
MRFLLFLELDLTKPSDMFRQTIQTQASDYVELLAELVR